ncbi:MAG: hypothetical protein O6940_13700 [Ignavibacteria bacterium]|nr:hypothetical protein [Ignavibacteria bacterium]
MEIRIITKVPSFWAHRKMRLLLLDEIKSRSDKASAFFTGQFKNKISLGFYQKHLLVNHWEKFVNGKNHINEIDEFWSYAKER